MARLVTSIEHSTFRLRLLPCLCLHLFACCTYLARRYSAIYLAESTSPPVLPFQLEELKSFAIVYIMGHYIHYTLHDYISYVMGDMIEVVMYSNEWKCRLVTCGRVQMREHEDPIEPQRRFFIAPCLRAPSALRLAFPACFFELCRRWTAHAWLSSKNSIAAKD